jgi:hypothetical protein
MYVLRDDINTGEESSMHACMVVLTQENLAVIPEEMRVEINGGPKRFGQIEAFVSPRSRALHHA